jgi:hypothetical protein
LKKDTLIQLNAFIDSVKSMSRESHFLIWFQRVLEYKRVISRTSLFWCITRCRFEVFWWGSLRERDQWGDPDVDGRIILRWIFRKWEGVVGNGWSGLRIGTGGGHL